MPEVNLIPMMDVLMTVLTFFIIVSMTLTGQRIFNVNLPTGQGKGDSEQGRAATLTIGIDPQKQISLKNEPITQTELAQEIQTFLAENPEGTIILKADRGLLYSDVAQVLKTMRDVGGNRVSLSFDRDGSDS